MVLGGGVAGVSCAQELFRLGDGKYDAPEIVIVSQGDTLKESSAVTKLTKYLEEIHVFEQSACKFAVDNPGIAVISSPVDKLDLVRKCLHLRDGGQVQYDKLCICSGAVPKPIADHPNVMTLRDLESIDGLLARLKMARNVAVVGNGGIAMELIHALTCCQLSWIVKDAFIGSAFLDATASVFLMPSLHMRLDAARDRQGDGSMHVVPAPLVVPSSPCLSLASSIQICNDGMRSREAPLTIHESSAAAAAAAAVPHGLGFALGPEWISKSDFLKRLAAERRADAVAGNLHIYMEQEVVAISDSRAGAGADEHEGDPGPFPVYLKTSSGIIIGCDFVISATGVYCDPLIEIADSAGDDEVVVGLALDEQCAVYVDSRMATSCPNVYAAGDCCHYTPSRGGGLGDKDQQDGGGGDSENWHQMKLWSQARILGRFAAQCMCDKDEENGGNASLKLFAHLTHFFGYKVVLLGRYNAQGFPEPVVLEVKATNFASPQLQAVSDTHRVVVVDEDDGTSRACLMGSHNCTQASDLTVYYRMCPGDHYIKVVVHQHRVIGALLLGDTDLEEVFENLILNGTDVSGYGVDILNPNVDLEDYFD